MLIATLPGIHRGELMEKIIAHPLIGGVRYNVGAVSPFGPKETLERILALTEEYGKKLWIDLKGRQLRVAQWTHRMLGRVVLNHQFEVDLPAHIHFRGDEQYDIKFVKGNEVWIDPLPKFFTGEGQSVNIHGDNLVVHGYLTETDKEYIRAALELGIFNFMLSFVESMDDVAEVEEFIDNSILPGNEMPKTDLVLKIESLRGMEFIAHASYASLEDYTLMAARDDLTINIGDNKAKILDAVEKIIMRDPNAIVASRIFSGLEKGSEVSVGDWADILLMKLMGYTHFMLSDEICNYNFNAAMQAWEDFCAIYPME